MTDILDEIENGKSPQEVVRKAENMLLLKSLKEVKNCCAACETDNGNEKEEKILATTV